MRILPFILLFFSVFSFAANIDDLITQAESNDPQAQLQLAKQYTQGIDVEVSLEDAFYWYQQAAEAGNTQAQIELADAYRFGRGVKQDLENAIYWLTSAAVENNTEAQYQLGQLYEQLEQQPNSLDLAQLWYEKASLNNPEAEIAYSRLLEQQFNNRRAKQVAAIGQLEVAFDDSEIKVSTQAKSLANSQKQRSEFVYGLIGMIVLCLAIIAWLFKTQRSLKHASSSTQSDSQRQSVKLERELKRKDDTIRQQKKQLETMFRHIKKLQAGTKQGQTAPPRAAPAKPATKESPLSLACALFGFKPDAIPEEKQIKVRYKQLSKIYHPDLKGSDEEMKRLNQALKIILKQVNK